MFVSNKDIIKAGLNIEGLQKDCLYYTADGLYFEDSKFPLDVESIHPHSFLSPVPTDMRPAHEIIQKRQASGIYAKRNKTTIKRQDEFKILYQETMKGNSSDWLKAMAAQCKDAYNSLPKGMICKNKKEYRNRWLEKLKYYIKEEESKCQLED